MSVAAPVRVLYTAEATAVGGRGGHARTSDGRLDVDPAIPTEMGGPAGPGTNPEQLFAAGYAACFQSALMGAARREHLTGDDSQVTARVGIGLIWLHVLGPRTPAYLTDKVIGLISTAGGVHGLQAVNTMEFVVRSLRAWAVPLVMPIPQASRAFDASGVLRDVHVEGQRADAGFAKPELYEALEKRGVKYAIRIPSNDTLEQAVAEMLRRPVGRPSHRPVVRYKSFRYQAGSWKTARRVVAKVEFHCEELFPRVGFIVTTLEIDNRAVVRFYNKRGTAEQWIRAGKEAVKLTRLSCHRFRANEVRLALSVITYNLGNLWRRLAMPRRIDTWSLTSLQQRLMKTGGRLVKHARYYWLLLAEGHLTRRLFGMIVRGLVALSVPAG